MSITSIIILTIMFVFFSALITPSMNFRLYEVNPEHFKKVKVVKFSWLFKGVGGKNSIYRDVKNYGIILPMFIMHIIGYIISILIIIVVTLLLIFKISPLIIIITISSLLALDLLSLFAITTVCIIISKKRDQKDIKK